MFIMSFTIIQYVFICWLDWFGSCNGACHFACWASIVHETYSTIFNRISCTHVTKTLLKIWIKCNTLNYSSKSPACKHAINKGDAQGVIWADKKQARRWQDLPWTWGSHNNWCHWWTEWWSWGWWGWWRWWIMRFGTVYHIHWCCEEGWFFCAFFVCDVRYKYNYLCICIHAR